MASPLRCSLGRIFGFVHMHPRVSVDCSLCLRQFTPLELAVLRLLRHLPKLVRGSSGGSSCLLHAYGSLVQASASRQSLYAHVGWRGWCANGPGLSQVSRRLSYRECAILTIELPQPHPAQVPSTRDCPSITLIDITLIHCAFFTCWPAQALPAALCFTRYCSQLCDLVQL